MGRDTWVLFLWHIIYVLFLCVCVCVFYTECKLTTILLTEYANIAILYSAPLTDPKQLSTREFLNCSAQEIIDDLNSKRKRDAALLEGNSSSCARDLE